MLVVGPLLLQLVCTHLAFRYPLDQEEWLVIAFCLMVAEAWLLNSIVIFHLEHLRAYPSRLNEISKRALKFLPKVLLSFAAVIAIAAGSAFIPVLLALVPFLIWAPIFSAAEAFAKVLPRKEESEEESFEGLFGDDGPDAEDRPQHLFTGMAIWDLGLGRSFGFSGAAFPLTLELVVLMWCAHVMPNAICYFLFGSAFNYTVEILALVISALASAVLISSAVAAFFSLLPKVARDELELPKVEQTVREGGRWSPTRGFVLLLLSPLAGLSTFYLVSIMQDRSLPPTNLVVDATQVTRRGEYLNWNVKLEDPEHNFRWLDPNRYRLVFRHQPAPVKDTEKEVPPEQDYELAPERYYTFQSEGRLVERFRPFYGPLRVEVRFRYPPQLVGDKKLALHYKSGKELGKALGEVQLSAIPEQK